MDIADPLAALSGWGSLGASGLLVLVILAILRGLLTPAPLIRREDAERAIAEVKEQAAARVADAHNARDEARARAAKAEEEASRWLDAWRVSESGRALAEGHVAALTRAMEPVTYALTSPEAVHGLGLPPRPPGP